jgi:hypothetical protein
LILGFRFVRFLVFTLEVAVASMNRFVDQFVLLFDASKHLTDCLIKEESGSRGR